MTDKFKRENKERRKTPEERSVNYTATMPQGVLNALDEQPGSRSANIVKAVKAYFMIG